MKGRLLKDSDTERAPFVAVLNQAAERRFFPGESAIGKHVQLGGIPTKEVPWMEVAGIVDDVKQNLATDSQAEMYVPYRQGDAILPVFAMSLVLRTAIDPRSEGSALRSAVQELDPNQPLVKIRTMEENIATSMNDQRFGTTLLTSFAVSALLLSVAGIYGVMVYSVTQRISEIGIRITLGAQRGQVLGMVLMQGLKMALLGVLFGSFGAFALNRVLVKFLYGVTSSDPITYGAAGLLLIAVAQLACYVPARRAMNVNPMIAVRHE